MFLSLFRSRGRPPQRGSAREIFGRHFPRLGWIGYFFLVSFRENRRKICWHPCLCWSFLQNSPENDPCKDHTAGNLAGKFAMSELLCSSFLQNSPEKFSLQSSYWGKLAGKFAMSDESAEKNSFGLWFTWQTKTWLMQGRLSTPRRIFQRSKSSWCFSSTSWSDAWKASTASAPWMMAKHMAEILLNPLPTKLTTGPPPWPPSPSPPTWPSTVTRMASLLSYPTGDMTMSVKQFIHWLSRGRSVTKSPVERVAGNTRNNSQQKKMFSCLGLKVFGRKELATHTHKMVFWNQPASAAHLSPHQLEPHQACCAVRIPGVFLKLRQKLGIDTSQLLLDCTAFILLKSPTRWMIMKLGRWDHFLQQKWSKDLKTWKKLTVLWLTKTCMTSSFFCIIPSPS